MNPAIYQPDEFLSRKCFEMSHALCRISANISHPDFKSRLERLALDILAFATEGNYPRVAGYCYTLHHMLILGADLNLIHPVNSNKIIEELGIINAAIAELPNPAKLPVNLDDVFLSNKSKKTKINTVPAKSPSKEDKQKNEAREVDDSIEHIAARSDVRQSAILDRIRQLGNCRLKEIQDLMPEVSERTLRYDLQKLVDQAQVERAGTGGPSTFYQIRKEGSDNPAVAESNSSIYSI